MRTLRQLVELEPASDTFDTYSSSLAVNIFNNSSFFPPMQMGRVELPSPWMRIQSINRWRMSCGRIGTAGADGVIMQLGRRDVRICDSEECAKCASFLLVTSFISACAKLMIVVLELLHDSSKFAPRKGENDNQVVRW